ncbi:hypothetical protein KI387_009647, partial [Taxus chinensis]
IWMHADLNHTGFLGRAEFYNALRLVTVAQSGRDLTPDIVRAALFGPAASKIPAPQIAAVPTVQATSHPVVPPVTFRGQQIQSTLAPAQQYVPPENKQFPRPVSTQTVITPTPLPTGLPEISLTGQRPQIPGGLTEWPGARIAGSTSVGPIINAAPTQSFQTRGSAPLPLKQEIFGQAGSTLQGGSVLPVPPTSTQDNARPGFSSGISDIKSTSTGGNGFSSDMIFGGDVFSATPQPRPIATSQPSVNNFSSSMALVSTSTVPSQTSYSVNNFSSSMALVSTSAAPSPAGTKQSQPDILQSATIVPLSVGVGVTASDLGGNTQLHWPRMIESNVIKYTNVFNEVDTDRDGKITGEQARDLFLSWRLPREVLKQVWDLSDQDGDSMLSLKEFCIALYLMERYREGRSLPSVLPSGIQVDEAMKSVPDVKTSAQRSAGFNGMPWQPNPGLQQHNVMASRPALHGMVPVSMPGKSPIPQSDSVNTGQSVQQKSRVPVVEMYLMNQLSQEEQNNLKSKLKGAEETEKKVTVVSRVLIGFSSDVRML